MPTLPGCPAPGCAQLKVSREPQNHLEPCSCSNSWGFFTVLATGSTRVRVLGSLLLGCWALGSVWQGCWVLGRLPLPHLLVCLCSLQAGPKGLVSMVARWAGQTVEARVSVDTAAGTEADVGDNGTLQGQAA